MKNGYSARTYQVVVDAEGGTETNVGTVLLPTGPPPLARISGVIADGMTSVPLSSADILPYREIVAVTDLVGRFLIPSTRLEWGSNVVEVRRIGYSPAESGMLGDCGVIAVWTRR